LRWAYCRYPPPRHKLLVLGIQASSSSNMSLNELADASDSEREREIKAILPQVVIRAKFRLGAKGLCTHGLFRVNPQLRDAAQRRQPIVAVGITGGGKGLQTVGLVRTRPT